MISKITLYLFFIYGNTCTAIKIATILSTVAILLTVIFSFVALMEEGDFPNVVKKNGKKVLICFIALLLLNIFLPNKNEMAAIFIIPKLSENKNIVELFPNIATLANKTIKKLIFDIKKDVAP